MVPLSASFHRPLLPAISAVHLILVLTLAVLSDSRELRPDVHGLGNQGEPGAASPAMKTFFGGRAPSDVALPEARNSSSSGGDDEFWAPGGRLGRGRRGEGHVKVVLLVASLVCGAGGLALLLGAGLFYFGVLRRRK